MAGRKRKSVALKKLEGTFRKDRHPTNVVELPMELPDKPSWTEHDPIANGLYDEIATHVSSMSISSRVDGISFSLLADQLSIYLKLRAEVLADGVIIEATGSTGQPIKKPHPGIATMNQTYNAIVKMLTEYGMTASSRARVGANKPIEINSFEDFLQN